MLHQKEWMLVDLRREDIECERSRTRVDMNITSASLLGSVLALTKFKLRNSYFFHSRYLQDSNFIHFNPQQLILLHPFFIPLDSDRQPLRCGEPRIWFGCRALNRQPLLVHHTRLRRKKGWIPLIPKPGNWCDVFLNCCTGTPSGLVLAMLQTAECLTIFVRYVRLLTKTLSSL